MSMHVKEILKFKRSFLKRLKEEVDGDHSGWERFVTRRPFRKSESNIYAVRKDEPCTIKYVETADSHLILRPHNPAYSIEIIALEDGQKPGDHIVGRVCYVGIET
jgi:hypothetical protein